MDIIKFLPLTVFMLIARSGGWTDFAWREAFIYGGICTIIVVAIQLYRRVILNRIVLGVNLFLLTGAVLFLTRSYSLLYYYGTYKGLIFLLCIALVGLCTTFFSKAGFIGLEGYDKSHIRKASLYLICVTFAGMIWSFIMNDYGLIVSVVIPFVLLRIILAIFTKQILISE